MTRCSALSAESTDGALPSFSAWTPRCTSRVASPPSSRIMLAPASPGQARICWVHHQYSSSVSPFQAKTGTPCGSSAVPSGPTTTAAAAWSWVEKMLQEAQRTSAPSATSVSMSTAVWIVMCSEPAIAGAGERLVGAVALAHRHQAGHLVLGERDLGAAVVGQAQIGNLEVHVDVFLSAIGVRSSVRDARSGYPRPRTSADTSGTAGVPWVTPAPDLSGRRAAGGLGPRVGLVALDVDVRLDVDHLGGRLGLAHRPLGGVDACAPRRRPTRDRADRRSSPRRAAPRGRGAGSSCG